MLLKKIFSGLALFIFSTIIHQSPAQAEVSSARDLMLDEESRQSQADDWNGIYAEESSVEVAQGRRRGASTGTANSPDFIGGGVSFGYSDDVAGSVIGKFSVTERWAVRPSLSLGENFTVLVPVTYQFNQKANVGGAQLSPYAGIGGSWSNENNNNGSGESDLKLLLSTGVDVPISRRFTLNAQANLGFINDTEFGATIGVGYNIGNILR